MYIANENERQEYVLNENGIIFVGNAKYIEARGWYYGQVSCRKLFCLQYHFNLPLFASLISNTYLYENWTNLAGSACGVLTMCLA